MRVATASLITAGLVPEGSGTEKPENPHDRRGAFPSFLDECRITLSPWQKQGGEEGQEQDRDHGARVVHWPSSRPPALLQDLQGRQIEEDLAGLLELPYLHRRPRLLAF